MNYQFPENLTLEEVRDIVNKHINNSGTKSSFFEFQKEDLSIFDYKVSFENTFQEVINNDRENAILRECRGLIFNKKTNRVYRRYHKFFNINEKNETRIENLPWNEPYQQLVKLDGSMISPILLNNEYRLTTKMGITDTSLKAEKTIYGKNNYYDLFNFLDKDNLNPIFEFCSNQNRIVISYPEEKVSLTAIRDNFSGNYLSYEQMLSYGDKFNIPVVEKINEIFSNHLDFLSFIYDKEELEGSVLRWNTGHMVKCKSLWYVTNHRLASNILFEKDIWNIVLDNKLDDYIICISEDKLNKMKSFQKDLFEKINQLSIDISKKLQTIYSQIGDDKKTFSTNYSKQFNQTIIKTIYNIWDSKNFEPDIISDLIISFLLKNTISSTGIEKNKNIIDISWDNYE